MSGTERIDTLDELELSVHHTIGENPLRSDEEYWKFIEWNSERMERELHTDSSQEEEE